jgi:hypothetical protein
VGGRSGLRAEMRMEKAGQGSCERLPEWSWRFASKRFGLANKKLAAPLPDLRGGCGGAKQQVLAYVYNEVDSVGLS